MPRILTQGDLVVGVDLHPELVPTPGGPVPVPIPNPFVGLVYDPKGMAVGIVVNNLVAAWQGQDPTLGIVMANGAPVAVVGDNAISLVKHLLIPPGTSWAPIPGAPPPPLAPGAPPRPPSAGSPANDAMLVQGAETVLAMGSSVAVEGSTALSCAEPIRMPTSMGQAIPKGAPVEVGGPLSVSFLGAAIGALRTRWVGALSRGVARRLSRLAFARLCCMLPRRLCHTVGHPVDVANGRLLTDHVDVALPGPVPLSFERSYSSRFADRAGPLGFGWSHSLDQAVWREERYGAVVIRDEEGRELELWADALPGGVLRAGQSLYDPLNRLTLFDDGGGRYRVCDAAGVTRRFAPVAAEKEQAALLEGAAGALAAPSTPTSADAPPPRFESKLVAIEGADGHAIRLFYDQHGRLHRVLDAVGRELLFEHDAEGRLSEVRAPSPDGHGHQRAWRYEYDPQGDLRHAFDAAGGRWSYDYVEHLMVRESDPENLAFYFEYDGLGPDAYCTRTWGHGGIHDTVLDYDKRGRRTVVTGSYPGEKTLYTMSPDLLVTGAEQAGFAAERFEHDEHGQLTGHVDRRGGRWRIERDAQGNVTCVERPDGARLVCEYAGDDDGRPTTDRPVRVLDFDGGEWRYRYDERGREVEARDPEGGVTRSSYRAGFLRRVELPGGLLVRLDHDRHGNLARVRSGSRAERRTLRFEHDALGRQLRSVGPRGETSQARYDELGRVVFERTPDGDEWDYRYDRAGNLLDRVHHKTHTRYEYDGYHLPCAVIFMGEGGVEEGRVTLERDLEGRLSALVNEN
ncbi:MAG: RHS repeat protein, partial [Sandaracinaceae bacterium]|nr:RHS repeat protein [Sandaracinaceae bacterium]